MTTASAAAAVRTVYMLLPAHTIIARTHPIAQPHLRPTQPPCVSTPHPTPPGPACVRYRCRPGWYGSDCARKKAGLEMEPGGRRGCRVWGRGQQDVPHEPRGQAGMPREADRAVHESLYIHESLYTNGGGSSTAAARLAPWQQNPPRSTGNRHARGPASSLPPPLCVAPRQRARWRPTPQAPPLPLPRASLPAPLPPWAFTPPPPYLRLPPQPPNHQPPAGDHEGPTPAKPWNSKVAVTPPAALPVPALPTRPRPLIYVYDMPPAYTSRMLQYRSTA